MTICFYQDSRHDEPLGWIRKVLGIGYLSRRNDGITELRINGYKQTQEILGMLEPYVRFKEKQTKLMLQASEILISKKLSEMNIQDRKHLARLVEKIRDENYQSGSKDKTDKLYKMLGLTPYRLNSKE